MPEERIMRGKSRLGLCVVIATAVALMLPAVVQGPTKTLGPESDFKWTYTLNKGDVLSWNWQIQGSGDIDFWVEDSQGTRYFDQKNVTDADGWLTIPADGDYTIGMINDATSGPSIEIEYDIDITPVGEATEFLSGLMLTFIVLGIVVFVVIILIVWAVTRKGKPDQPKSPPVQ